MRLHHPAILQPASVFLDLSGEDMRGRLLLASDGAGGDFCLRPEFTIPVSLAYLASPRCRRAGRLLLLRPGVSPAARPVAGIHAGRARKFRSRRPRGGRRRNSGPGSGGSRPAATGGSRSATPALLAGFARKSRRSRRCGCAASAAASPRARSSTKFSIPPSTGKADHSGVLAALDGADKPGARALVEDLLKIAGISALGGRTAGEIAERFLEQAELRSGAGLDADKRGVLEQFFAIDGDQPDQASAQLRALVRRRRARSRRSEIDAFDQRLEFHRGARHRHGHVDFSAGFARNLDYYTGFVFEALDADGRTNRAGDRRRPLRPAAVDARRQERHSRRRRGDLDRTPRSAARRDESAMSEAEARSGGSLEGPPAGKRQRLFRPRRPRPSAGARRARLSRRAGRRRQCRSRLSVGVGNRQESRLRRRAFRRHGRGSGARGAGRRQGRAVDAARLRPRQCRRRRAAGLDRRAQHGRSRRCRRGLSRPARRADAGRDQICQHHPRLLPRQGRDRLSHRRKPRRDRRRAGRRAGRTDRRHHLDRRDARRQWR